MEDEIFAIKLGTNIVLGYEINGQPTIIKDKEQNSCFDYLVILDNKIEIDAKEIIDNVIEKKIGQINKDIKITYIDEIFKIEHIKSGNIYLIDDILIKLFERIKLIIKGLIDKQLNKAIIICNNIPNEIILILHRAALLANIQIINFIDLTKSIAFFLNYKKIITDKSISLIKLDKKIEISIFEKQNMKRIYYSNINKSNINIDNSSIKEEINEINDKSDYFLYLKKIINNLTVEAYGIEEKLDKIFIINNLENNYFNEISITGALYSKNFPKSKECLLIFNFIDFEKNYLLKELIIMKNRYKIKQKILKIFIDDSDIPFEDCYYKNIRINFNNNSELVLENIITIYYNQKNYYCCFKTDKDATSTELIFFKNIPIIKIDDKYNIEIEEEFEENQIFKRINILNVNREIIKLNGNPLIFYDFEDTSKTAPYKLSEEELFPDILILIGQNFDILSYFNKDTLYKSSIIKDDLKIELLGKLNFVDIIDKDDSFENLIKNRGVLFNNIKICNFSFNIRKFEKYLTGNIQNYNNYDINVLIKYGKYRILKEIFYDINKTELNINETNFKRYKKILNSLNLFYEKCKGIEKDSLQLAKIYNAACFMLLDYPKKSLDNNENIIFDIIQFNKDNIYKDANGNNFELILNLTKKSFLYPYFLQFNSSFNASQTLFYQNNLIITCKVSMITLNQIKLDLVKSLPKYGIRIFFDTDYFADTIINTGITIYNEKNIFGHFLNQSELDNKNDINYVKRVKISFLQKHERFGHFKKYLNKSEKEFVISPRGIINYESNKIMILAAKGNLEKGELGESLEYIMTNGNRSLIDNLFYLGENIDLKELYIINIFLENNNDNLVSKLESFPNVIPKDKVKIKIDSEKKNESDEIKKKKKYLEKNIDGKNDIKSDNTIEFEKRKIQMIEENPIRKYTFLKNTIQEYRIINGNLVPVNKEQK
jgi:hypothetical protein